MKIVIIGGVAAGTKAAAKLKRLDRSADIELYTKSADISYAGCGLPYYVGGDIETREELIVNTPTKFSALTGVTVFTEHEAMKVNSSEKTVLVRSLVDNTDKTVSYDKLIIASGASPVIPNIEGVNLNGVFCVRTPDDAEAIRAYIKENGCKRAIITGAGFIGMEMAENLMQQNISVTVMDMCDQILPNILDYEMASYAAKQLRNDGMKILTGTTLNTINGEASVESVSTSAGEFKADIVIMCIGIRPTTDFLKDSGIDMIKGAICVDEYQKTNIDDIYAAGDCAIVKNRLTSKPQWSAMGSTANITARLLSKTIMGENSSYAGCLGTGVVKLSKTLNAGRTGLSEKQSKEAGYDVETVVCVTDDKAH